ncbi:MAG: hypothetical protein IJ002_07140 [Clostridia bacterium]|nr:hypothetical protein [Clostridia bacterium]
MKKFISITVVVILALLLLNAAYLVFGNSDFFKELPQRLAVYHNTGNITVTVDGENMFRFTVPVEGTMMLQLISVTLTLTGGMK